MGKNIQDRDAQKPLLEGSFPPPPAQSSTRREVEIFVLILLTIAFGALNRVCSKIMTEPMNNYSFFLSIFNGIAYVLFYGTILGVRYALGLVTKKSLMFPFRTPPPSGPASPWWCLGGGWWWWDRMWGIKYFMFTGLLEGFGNILGTIANPYVSGIMGSLATQVIVLFAMPCAIIMLGTRYTIWQVLAATVVLVGAMVAIVPSLMSTSNNGPIGYILLMAISNLPNAISFTIKELVFQKEKTLELFVVNTMGSVFQLVWWPLMVPITLLLNQTEGLPLWTYIKYGFMCFSGHTPPHSNANCSPMPTPYIAYILINMAFNISLLALLKRASALQGFMAVKAILPVGVFLFLIHWPLIGASTLNKESTISLIIILIGLGLYRWSTYEKERAKENTYSFKV